MTTVPGLDDTCPHIPDGATTWEAQEIRRHWRNALMALDEVGATVHAETDRLWNRGRVAVPRGSGITYQGPRDAHVAQRTVEAVRSMEAMARVIDGCVHRQAVTADPQVGRCG